MLRSLLRFINRLFWGVLTLALVTLALVVSLGRYYMPQLGEYQQQILAQVRAHTELVFELESLEGEWRGLSPVVRVKNFRLFNPDGDVVVRAEHLAVYFDLIETLYHRTPLARTVSLVKVDIELGRSATGAWGLKGIGRNADSSWAGAAAAEFVEQIDLLELAQLQIGVWLPDHPRHSIESLSLVLRQGLDLSQLSLELKEQGRPSLRLAAEFEGWLDDPRSLRSYLTLDKVSMDTVKPLLAQWYKKLPPRLSGEVWLDWQLDEGMETSGTLITSDWRLSQMLEREVPDLKALDFDFMLEMSLDGRIAGRIQDLGFRWTGIDYRFPEVEFSLDGGRRDLAVQLSSASIEPLVEGAIDSRQLPEQLVTVFETLKPRGKLRNIHLDIPLQKDRMSEFRIRANLEDAALESWKGAPGARSIDGYVEAGLEHGRVDLDGSYLQLDFPGLYDVPLDFAGVDTQVGWRIGERVKVNSGPIKLHGDFGTGMGQLDLDIPLVATEGDYPRMSLMIGLQDTDAKYRNRYIPKILSKKLLSWLDSSVKSARVDELGFIYYGALTSPNPLDKTVQLFLDGREARLRYQPDWPLLEQAEVHLVLSDGYLHAQAPQAKIMDSKLSNVQVELNQRDGVSWLDITGLLEGPAGDLIRLLNESPLRDATAGAFESWNARGKYSARLDLDIPMASSPASSIAVDGELKGVELDNKGLGLGFTDLQGKMRYRSAEGVTAKRLRGKLWGKTLVASVGPGPATEAGMPPMLLRAEGEVAVESLHQWLDSPALGLASGSAMMQAELTIVAAGDKSQASNLNIRSDLVGVEFALPAPFGKTVGRRVTTSLDISLADVGRGELHYGSLAAGCFDISEDEPRAGIWLGSDTVPDLPASGIRLSGALAQADLSQWVDTLAEFTRLAGESSTAPQDLLRVEELSIGRLRAYGQEVENPLLNIGVFDQRWRVSIEHPRLTGTVDLPIDDGEFSIDLAHLRMPLSDVASTGSAGMASLDPAELPAADVVIGEFGIGDKNMGSWRFKLKPEEKGVAVRGLTITVAGAIFGGLDIAEGAELDWTLDGGVHRSRLQGMMRAGNLDDLFSHWGYDAGVVSESAEVIVYFHWDGAPDAIDLPVVAGDMFLTVRQGQLQQTSGTAAEALKLVGILNINNLARRLRLDFSDMYKKGLSYDRIVGILMFDRGELTMVEPLVVEGPSSSLKMTGDFNFISGAIDAEMVVALPITANLPWVVALTLPGGIPLAAGVFVAGKVFEKQLQKLTSAVYSLSGTMDDPTVSFKRLTNVGTSKKKSSRSGRSSGGSKPTR